MKFATHGAVVSALVIEFMGRISKPFHAFKFHSKACYFGFDKLLCRLLELRGKYPWGLTKISKLSITYLIAKGIDEFQFSSFTGVRLIFRYPILKRRHFFRGLYQAGPDSLMYHRDI